MSKNAMAGAVTLCGVGLCVIGAALMMQNGSSAHAAGAMPPAAAAAVASATHAQAGPTVVWYQSMLLPHGSWDVSLTGVHDGLLLLRAWSDGTVEARLKDIHAVGPSACTSYPESVPFMDVYPACNSGWFVISSPNEGFKAAADINADEKIDGVDLASILGNWGDAPRVPFPPSDCPLNLINP